MKHGRALGVTQRIERARHIGRFGHIALDQVHARWQCGHHRFAGCRVEVLEHHERAGVGQARLGQPLQQGRSDVPRAG